MAFSIFKKKQTGKVDLSELASDMHSHLIAGIDDGAKDADDSIELVKGLVDLGYKNLITTPHIMWGMYNNEEPGITQGHQHLQKVLKENNLNITTGAAAEYFLDDHFTDLLQSNTALLPVKENWVLVEFSFAAPPMKMKDLIFEMQIKGYQPILAHPERYLYFAANKAAFDELKTLGCFFQVNLLSLSGYYGKECVDLANYLIKKQYVDFLGTDMHHIRHLQALQAAYQIMAPVKALLDTGKILNPSL